MLEIELASKVGHLSADFVNLYADIDFLGFGLHFDFNYLWWDLCMHQQKWLWLAMPFMGNVVDLT